jgi:drug/metabolite transporter (DMT)-like permease
MLLGVGYGATAVASVSISSGLVVAFIAVSPALVALFELPYGVRPTPVQTAGIALGLAGVVMLTQGQGYAASLPGLLAISTACVAWALGSVWARHGLPGGHTLALAPGAAGFASQMLAGGVMLLAASVLAGESVSWPLDPRAVGSWAYLVVAGSIIGFSAYMILLQRTSAATASSYTYVNPVIGLLLGVSLGGEVVSGFEWAAAGVVLAGVVLLLAGRRS